ncbi:MAG TPA: TetR family transcriptional regulator [Solirubrobacteraceae bacterium]|nr:TetR family transcriptional regulator [Solirubrobacteraceae bacterium]
MSAEPTPRPRRGEGRDALLRAVLRVVDKYGFAGLTYRAVAAEAGVTHGLVSYHFGSLDAMISEALALAADEAIRDSRMAISSGELAAFAKSISTLVSEQTEAQTYQYELTFEARRRRELAGHIRALYENYYAVIEHSLTALGIPRDRALTRLVFAALDGLVLQQLIFGDARATDASIERLQELLALLAGADS